MEKLGYNYSQGESTDTSLLRTLSIEQALFAGDEGCVSSIYDSLCSCWEYCSVIRELRERFKKSRDKPDLLGNLRPAIYMAVSKLPLICHSFFLITSRLPNMVGEGSMILWQKFIIILECLQTVSLQCTSVIQFPTLKYVLKIPNRHALSSAQDKSLIKETLIFISKKTRNQDVLQFFIGLARNNDAKRLLTQYVEEEYNAVNGFATCIDSASQLKWFADIHTIWRDILPPRSCSGEHFHCDDVWRSKFNN